MDNINFTKSFSNGQITIPKAIREKLGLKNNFWLKLYTENNKIIVEPIEISEKPKNYLAKLSSIKGSWFDPSEYRKNRKEIEERLA